MCKKGYIEWSVIQWVLVLGRGKVGLYTMKMNYFFEYSAFNDLNRVNIYFEQRLIDWLIDCFEFYAVSAIFQPRNGGDY